MADLNQAASGVPKPAVQSDTLGNASDSSPSSNGPAHDSTNQVLAYFVTGAFFALIVLLMFSTEIMPKATTDAGVKDLLFTLLGVVATGWANIIGFYFGSSVGSAQKSQTIRSVLLQGNPPKSLSGSQV